MPGPREIIIAESIVASVLRDKPTPFWQRLKSASLGPSLALEALRQDLFVPLRELWGIQHEEYQQSFRAPHTPEKVTDRRRALQSLGDMGFSGSTFYSTTDSKYLVKSVPRRFEHSFFRDDLLEPYSRHMQQNLGSLLVHITDFLENTQTSIGSMFGLAPSHHIVMQNILEGKDKSEKENTNAEWETWDLKPMTYFYPERDVAGGALTSDETKDKLADTFDGKLVLSLDAAEELKGNLEKDTALLAKCNAVDYSLFLVRIPVQSDSGEAIDASSSTKPNPLVAGGSADWRTGVPSADGKFVYRAAVLDFFWAKHKLTAKAMTGLINAYNVVDRQGPMSVTTDSNEYRQRFLKMCTEMIEVEKKE